MIDSRRRFLALSAGALAAAGARRAQSQTKPTIDVKKLGAFGDGRLSDRHVVREAVRLAARRPGGATIYFPPGDYFLGSADAEPLVTAKRLRNVRFVGNRATLSCRSVEGQSSMLNLEGCANVLIEGLQFRDRGANRDIDWLGAAGIALMSDGAAGCENIAIADCRFDSVLTAVLSRASGDPGRCRGVTLTNLTVRRSYYGLNFQDNCDDVTGRKLLFDDVKRSYFPYGVSNHDIELEAVNNGTGYTDVLIKCYTRETASIRVKVRSRGKRGGDAIVGIDQQHERGRGLIRRVGIDLDVADADCRLDAVVMMRSFDRNGRFEKTTSSRWDDITVDGNVSICDSTKLFEVPTVSSTPGRLFIGSRLAANPRLPARVPGFVVARARA